jgi:hypothetical protein
MTYQEEFERVRKQLHDMLKGDDIILAERARELRNIREMMDFLQVLRYHNTYHYPCCSGAYKYLKEAIERLVRLVMQDAGLLGGGGDHERRGE